jgi:tetratricopeptide (TPR) repeat protein
MRKFIIAATLTLTVVAVAQTGTTTGTAQPQSSQTPAQPQAQAPAAAQQTKTIKDPTEYNAYITATQVADPAQKAAALEAFVQQYPNSIVKEDALNAAMGAYQQAGNSAKSSAIANQILQLNPNNVPACVVVVFGLRQQAVQQGNAQTAIQAGQMAERCIPSLQTWKFEGDEATVAKQKTVFTSILNNAAGTAALQQKDYPRAQQYLNAAVAANPASPDDTYNLALSYLLPRPNTDDNTLKGLYFVARALNMVAGNAAAEKQIGDYGKSVYKRYHGGEDGWPEFVAQVKAANSPAPPADMTTMIKKAPSPAEQVKTIIAQNPDLTQADFGTWVLVFTYGDQATKDSSFAQLKDKAFKFQGQIISADENSADIALTQDAIEQKKAEVHVTMEEPFKKVPAPGSQFQFQGTAQSYTSEPFLITMDKGIDLTPKAKPPVRKPPTKRPATRKK